MIKVKERSRPERELATSGTLGVLAHPDDVLGHPHMTTEDKRAVLASWISDAHTVENAPSLRQLQSGAVVSVNEILHALKSLDGDDTATSEQKQQWSAFGRRRTIMSRLHDRVWSHRKRDDDDDPPPCPASAALPRRTVPTLEVVAA